MDTRTAGKERSQEEGGTQEIKICKKTTNFFGNYLTQAGKSTLLNMVGGLDTPTSGEVVIGGKLCAFLCVRNGLHFYKELLVEIKCGNDMGTGCNINPNKKR